MMLADVKKAPEGICPYCSRLVQASLLKRRWFHRNQYLCAHLDCKKVVYICLSTSCDNYVKSEKKSSKYCDICRSGYMGDSGGGDGGVGDFSSPSEQREYIGSRQKTSNDTGADNTYADSGGDAGGGDGGGGD